MKKILISVALLSLLLAGCNRTIVDTTWTYKSADINGIGTVEVSSWTDYENSDIHNREIVPLDDPRDHQYEILPIRRTGKDRAAIISIRAEFNPEKTEKL